MEELVGQPCELVGHDDIAADITLIVNGNEEIHIIPLAVALVGKELRGGNQPAFNRLAVAFGDEDIHGVRIMKLRIAGEIRERKIDDMRIHHDEEGLTLKPRGVAEKAVQLLLEIVVIHRLDNLFLHRVEATFDHIGGHGVARDSAGKHTTPVVVVTAVDTPAAFSGMELAGDGCLLRNRLAAEEPVQ